MVVVMNENANEVIFDKTITKPEDYEAAVVGNIEIYIKFPTIVFLETQTTKDQQSEKERLEKQLQTAQSQIERLERQLASEFSQKAPAEMVAKEKEKLATWKDTAEKIKAQLK